MTHALLSSERMDWRSPEWFLDLVREVGPIDLDPCTTVDNPTGAARIIVQPPRAWPLPPCGLSSSWERAGLAFANPPYGAHLSGAVEPGREIWRVDRRTKDRRIVGVGTGWAARIAQELDGETLVLVPVRTETAWWRTLFAWADRVLLWSSPVHGCRISFINPETGRPQQGSNLASTVFYRGPQARRFGHAFSPHGELIRGKAQRPKRQREVVDPRQLVLLEGAA